MLHRGASRLSVHRVGALRSDLLHARIEDDLILTAQHLRNRVRLPRLYELLAAEPRLQALVTTQPTRTVTTHDAIQFLFVATSRQELGTEPKLSASHTDATLLDSGRSPWSHVPARTLGLSAARNAGLGSLSHIAGALIDQQVCLGATFFVGPPFSSFSFYIYYSRQVLGMSNTFSYTKRKGIRRHGQPGDVEWPVWFGEVL